MKYLSLFSGIEAATAAWHPLGWECVAVSEIEPFPCAVLAHHYPNAPNIGDVTKVTEQGIAALGPIDVVVFGSPCQDLSVAGHRKGLINAEGTVTRSGLFFTAVNIFLWARKHCGARYALWENVPGAFSSNKGRDFGSVVEFLAGLDEVPVPPKGWGTEGVALGSNGLVEWATLDAQWFGVAQRRRRVFALLDAGDWASRPPILLEPESMRGDSPPRRETGKDVTRTTALSVALRGREGGATAELGGDVASTLRCSGGGGDKPHALIHADAIARCITSGEAKRQDWETCNFVAIRGIDNENNGFEVGGVYGPLMKGSPTGGGHPLPAVSYAIRLANTGSNGWCISEELTPTLDQAQPHAVAFAHVETVPTMQVGSGNPAGHGARSGDTKDAYIVPVALVRYASETNAAGLVMGQGAVSATLNTFSDPTAQFLNIGMHVRRLTLIECERLQGFPDGYTNIPWRKKSEAPDGHRYKALGNSMAVPVMRWIGESISFASFISTGEM